MIHPLQWLMDRAVHCQVSSLNNSLYRTRGVSMSVFGDGGGGALLSVVCWHEWVNHSHCCLGSQPQQCAPNRTVGSRRQISGPLRNIFCSHLMPYLRGFI